VLREVERVFGSPMFVQVSGRADQVTRHLAQPPCNERGSWLDSDTDRSVETFANHVCQCITQVQQPFARTGLCVTTLQE
jgi:hypothetical protein